jgi:hypothetical protein
LIRNKALNEKDDELLRKVDETDIKKDYMNEILDPGQKDYNDSDNDEDVSIHNEFWEDFGEYRSEMQKIKQEKIAVKNEEKKLDSDGEEQRAPDTAIAVLFENLNKV